MLRPNGCAGLAGRVITALIDVRVCAESMSRAFLCLFDQLLALPADFATGQSSN